MIVLPYFISLLYLILSYTFFFELVKNLESETFYLQQIKRKEFHLEYCGRLKSLINNIKDVSYFLRMRISQAKIKELLRAKEIVLSEIESLQKKNKCNSLVEIDLKTLVYKEQNRNLDPFWPNWVLSYF